MAAFSGHLHRPLSAMAVAALAAVSSSHHRLSDSEASTSADALASLPSTTRADVPPPPAAAAAAPSASALSGAQLLPRDLHSTRHLKAPFASLPVMQTVYQYYANFPKTAGQADATPMTLTPSSPPADALYLWHLPDPRARADFPGRSQTVVVLLGWLGSRQKHLRRYADWYTSRGFHAVTFTLPMSDIVSYSLGGGKAEKNVEMLSEHVAGWVREESGKRIVFHTFSNTGWLCYGVILENLRQQDPSAVDKITACVVDSAPVAAPDPQVWASGFLAALMKKRSATTKGLGSTELGATEAVLLSALETFFDVVFNYPKINRRLSDVMELLSWKQPRCPQLYIYSSADRVIPAKAVEAFIDGQRRAGHEVRACDFVSSPHVDHYRSNPGLYSSQLANFLEECVLAKRCQGA